MKLEDTIAKTEIKKILVADDTTANIDAAKQYFSTLEKLGIKVDFAASANEAKDKIRNAYEKNEKYAMVITDLSMEEPKSGMDVAREGFKHLAYSMIATGFNYDVPDGHHHGPITNLHPLNERISGKKDKPEVWEAIFSKAMDYLAEGDGKSAFAAMKRFDKYIGQPSDGIAETMMMMLEIDLG